MATTNRIDKNFADCKVYDFGAWRNGRYQHHKRRDGKVVVQVSTGIAKTNRTFSPDRVQLNENVEVIVK